MSSCEVVNSGHEERPIFFVTGSTGTGKSAFSVDLAKSLKNKGFLHVVVVNCDVSQFYEGLPIATNKISEEETSSIPHVFLNFLASDNSFTSHPWDPCWGPRLLGTRNTPTAKFSGIQTFTSLATEFIDAFFKEFKNAAVVVCGGTIYYLQSVLFANMTQEKTPETIIQADESELWGRLNAVDPITAAKYHPNDTRRLRRLVEIAEAAGAPPSSIFSAPKFRYDPSRCMVIWLYMPMQILTPLLENRVDEMNKRGLVEEVKGFYQSSAYSGSHSSLHEAIGVKELTSAFADLSSRSPSTLSDLPQEFLEKPLQQIKINTKRYAEKQIKWMSNRLCFLISESDGCQSAQRRFIKISLRDKSSISEATDLVCGLFNKTALEINTSICEFPLENFEVKSEITTQRCEVCDLTICGRDSYDAHTKSKRHKGAIKRREAEKRFLERFGTPLPPKKRERVDL